MCCTVSHSLPGLAGCTHTTTVTTSLFAEICDTYPGVLTLGSRGRVTIPKLTSCGSCLTVIRNVDGVVGNASFL